MTVEEDTPLAGRRRRDTLESGGRLFSEVRMNVARPLVFGLVLLRLASPAAAQASGTHQIPVEVVSTDVVGQTVSGKRAAPAPATNAPIATSVVTFLVEASAAPILPTLRGGERVTLTCRSRTAMAQAAPSPA